MRPNRPWLFTLLLAAAFVAGGLSPVRAGTEDAVVRQLERISDSLRELAHRDTKTTVCECRCGG